MRAYSARLIRLLVIILITITVVFVNCSSPDGDFLEIKQKPQLIVSMDPPSDDISIDKIDKDYINQDRFDDGACLVSKNPILVWSEISEALDYDVVIINTGTSNSYVFDNVMSDAEYTVDDDLAYAVTDEDLDFSESSADNEEDLFPYKWTIRAKNKFQYMPSNEVRSFYILASLVAPTALVNPQNGCINDTYTFTWGKTKQHTYEAQVSKDDFVDNIVPITVTKTDATAVIDSGGSYKWRVRSKVIGGKQCDKMCEWSEWVVSENTFDVIELQAPTVEQVDPNPSTDGMIVFNWNNGEQIPDSVVLQVGADEASLADYATIGDVETYDAGADKGKMEGGLYTWRVKLVKGGCESPWSNLGNFEVELCTVPTWGPVPSGCIKDASTATISVTGGSTNLKYNFQIKNPLITWGTVESGFKTDTTYNVDAGLGVYGAIEYRVQYDNDDTFGNDSGCEGTIDGTAPFSYIVPPANLVVNGQTTIQTGVNDNSGAVIFVLEWDAYSGMEYDIDITDRNGAHHFDTLVSANCSTVAGNRWVVTNGIDVNMGCLEDGWWQWRIRCRATGDPTCESEWVDGPANLDGDATHDICYVDWVAAGISAWNVFNNWSVGSPAYTADGLTFNDPNPNGNAIKIILDNDDTFGNGNEIKSAALASINQGSGASNIDLYLSGLFPAGTFGNGKHYKHLYITETKYPDSCMGQLNYSEITGAPANPPDNRYVIGIEYVGSPPVSGQFKQCNDLSANPCDGV